VVTGLGVVAPNGVGVAAFERALRDGRSGVRAIPRMAELGFGCRVAAVPLDVDEHAAKEFSPDLLRAMNSNHRYAALAALECWRDAGFARPERGDDRVDWDTGAVVGTGVGGMDTIAERVVPLTDAGEVRRLGSTAVEQSMASGPSARVAGLLGLGNQVTTNSSACATGTEAIVLGAERIRSGRAERMLCGGSEGASVHAWAGFDSLRVLARGWNETPERASRPLSASAAGFVPGAGAAVLMLESLASATARGARIHAEVLGGAVNCGGQRGGGSMTAPHRAAVVRCIRAALADAAIEANAVSAINGHCTATGADPGEVRSWAEALGCEPGDLPPLTATKSLIGHTLGAAGAIESVACMRMLAGGFLHGAPNCEDLHPELAPFAASVVHETRAAPELRAVAKAGFGFGDVNACIVVGRWNGA
jgi:3-oxoacyl-(acyl-carrier-protein) synthase